MRMLFMSLFLCFAASTTTLANLIVSPNRIDLNEENKTAIISMVNQAHEVVSYRIGWIPFSMLNDGSYQETKETRTDAKQLESLIRFTPRQVSLKPGETQLIRLSVPSTRNIKNGEYRSHLVLKAAPTNLAHAEPGSDGTEIYLSFTKGFSLPIFYRKGDLQTKVSLSPPQIIKRPDTTLISVQINQDGSASPLGDLHVKATINEKEETIGLLRGVAVFLETPYRLVEIPLSEPEKLKLATKIRVLYLKPNATSNTEVIGSSVFVNL